MLRVPSLGVSGWVRGPMCPAEKPLESDYLCLLRYLSFFSFQWQTFGKQSEPFVKKKGSIWWIMRLNRSISTLKRLKNHSQVWDRSQKLSFIIITEFYNFNWISQFWQGSGSTVMIKSGHDWPKLAKAKQPTNNHPPYMIDRVNNLVQIFHMDFND